MDKILDRIGEFTQSIVDFLKAVAKFISDFIDKLF